MSTTINNLIIGAMRLINVVAANETPSASDMNIALSALDAMIDSWSNNRNLVFNIQQQIVSTVGGQQTYLLGPCQGIVTMGSIVPGSGYVNGTYTNVPLTTLTGNGQAAFGTVTVTSSAVSSIVVSSNMADPGDLTQGAGFGYLPGDTITVSNTLIGGAGTGFQATVTSNSGGDWPTIRPVRIEDAYVIWNDPLSSQAVDIPMVNMTYEEYAAITVKQTPSTFAFAFYDDNNYPLKTISLWPIPTGSTNIRLWLRMPLVDFTDLNAILTWPPGYERAFRFNLAIELAAEFGKDIPEQVAQIANSTVEDLITTNAIPRYLIGPSGLTGGKNSYNYITGGFFGIGPGW